MIYGFWWPTEIFPSHYFISFPLSQSMSPSFLCLSLCFVCTYISLYNITCRSICYDYSLSRYRFLCIFHLTYTYTHLWSCAFLSSIKLSLCISCYFVSMHIFFLCFYLNLDLSLTSICLFFNKSSSIILLIKLSKFLTI